MEKKSLAVQLITVVVLMIGAYSGMFGTGSQAWLGIVSMAATLALTTFFPSGTVVKGWTAVMWLVNLGGIVVQLMNAMGSAGLVSAEVTNAIMIGINIIIQVFAKDYVLPVTKV